MNRLRIAIDPHLAELYGPEIHWTWRLLLTGIGWAWQEVPLQDGRGCDIAYVQELSQASHARLAIQADAAAWARPAHYRLGGVGRQNGLLHPFFRGKCEDLTPVWTKAGRLICQRDILFDVFWLATGQEERYWPRDGNGNFDLSGTIALRERVPFHALASHIATWLQTKLMGLGVPPPLPRWPHGKRAAAGVGHDVDYPQVKRWLEPLRIVMRQGWQGVTPALDVLAGRRHHWQFPAWVKEEKRLQTRSAFYFVARRGSLLGYATGTPDPFYDIRSPAFRDLFRYLRDEGFEIGLHASYHACRSQDRFAAEKNLLEEASGQLVVGNRHHYWHLNPDDVEETLLMHERIGFKYDTSLTHDRYLGWRRGLSYPFFPFHQSKRRELATLQIPTGWMDDQLFGRRADNPGDPVKLLQVLADRTAEQGGALLIDVHDYVFDDVLFPGWRQTFQELWEYLLARGDYWFATPAQIAEHWTSRYAALVRASHGLEEGILSGLYASR